MFANPCETVVLGQVIRLQPTESRRARRLETYRKRRGILDFLPICVGVIFALRLTWGMAQTSPHRGNGREKKVRGNETIALGRVLVVGPIGFHHSLSDSHLERQESIETIGGAAAEQSDAASLVNVCRGFLSLKPWMVTLRH